MADAIAPFAPALSELGLEAFERVGIQANALTVTHVNSLRRSMNLVLVRWSLRGINLWRVSPVTVTLVAGQANYTLDPATLDVLDTYRRTAFGGVNTDVMLSPMSRATFAALSNKAQAGAPIMYQFDRQIDPVLTLWPVPDTANYTLVYYAFTQIIDADPSGGNTGNLPYRFLEAFTAGVAASLAQKWADPQRAVALDAYAKETFVEAADDDVETVTVTMAPDLGSYFG